MKTFTERKNLMLGLVVALALLLVLVIAWLRHTSEPDFGISIPERPDFTEYPAGAERKKVFFDYFLALVRLNNQKVLHTRQQIQQWYKDRDDLSNGTQKRLRALAEDYRVENFDPANASSWQTLLRRVDIVPPSMALAQAANESAWGTSRFAREANNFYGQWCFKKGCGVVPEQRVEGGIHEVAKYESANESVQRYILNINSHPAYKQLRLLRAQMRKAKQPIEGLKLATTLGSYSERGAMYIEELQSMIRFNKLQQYDG